MKLIDEYVNHLELNQVLSFNSLRLYKTDLKDFSFFLVSNRGANFDLTKLSPEILEQFSKQILNQKKSIATVNRKLSAIHGLWSWLKESGQVSRDPFTQIKRGPQFRNKNSDFLTEEQIVILLDFSEHDLKTKIILEIIYATGIRVGELVELTLVDLDLENQLITIPRSTRFKERTIPFNLFLKNLLTEYIKEKNLSPNNHLIVNRLNQGVSEREVFRLLRVAGKKSGLKINVTPSILRNSFLKHMKASGAHPTLLRDITGQKTVRT